MFYRIALLAVLAFGGAAVAGAEAPAAWDEFLAGLALEYGAEPDAALARSHYQTAARAGSREALLGLARLHAPGGPLWRDAGLWRDCLLAAAQAGWPAAAFDLAEALAGGTIIDERLKAADFYLQAAAAGHPPAARRLAGLYAGEGGETGRERALLWLTVAAGQGDRAAALELGRLYFKDKPEKAAGWLERADGPEAQYLLGEIYLRDRRVDDAVAALTRSAAAGYPRADLSLGLLALDNDFGRRPDPRAALKHFKIAAGADLPEGAYRLARMFLNGQATPKDPITGAFWLRRAAQGGHEQAKEEYERLSRNFTSGQSKRLERMLEEGLAPTTRTLPPASSPNPAGPDSEEPQYTPGG